MRSSASITAGFEAEWFLTDNIYLSAIGRSTMSQDRGACQMRLSGTQILPVLLHGRLGVSGSAYAHGGTEPPGPLLPGAVPAGSPEAEGKRSGRARRRTGFLRHPGIQESGQPGLSGRACPSAPV